MKIEDIAIICHEANVALCETQMDFSQSSWDLAPNWQKKSAIEGVKYHINNLNATPEDSHKSWMEHKIKEGWIYGPIKDVNKKTHPCMIPYQDLPKSQQIKDYLYSAIVKTLIPFLTKRF